MAFRLCILQFIGTSEWSELNGIFSASLQMIWFWFVDRSRKRNVWRDMKFCYQWTLSLPHTKRNQIDKTKKTKAFVSMRVRFLFAFRSTPTTEPQSKPIIFTKSRNHETRKQNKQKFQFGCCNASHHHRMAPHRERTILSVFQKTKVYVSTNSPTPTLIINEILWKIITKQLCQQNVNFQDGESFVGSNIASLSQNKNFCTSFEYLLIWHSLQLNSSFNSTHTRLWSSRKANIQL